MVIDGFRLENHHGDPRQGNREIHPESGQPGHALVIAPGADLLGVLPALEDHDEGQDQHGDIRQKIVEADLVEGIIALPSQLFYSTGIPVSLWFLSRHKEQPGKVLFIDARNMGTMVTRAVRELMQEDILRIAETFENFRCGTLEDEAGYCAVKTLEDVKAQDFILTPGRYVGIAEQEDDGEPFDEKMKRLTSELSTLFADSHRLEDEIKKQLGSIGFEI